MSLKKSQSSHHRSMSSGPKIADYKEREPKKSLKSQVTRGSVFCDKVLSQTVEVLFKETIPKPLFHAV